MPKFNVRLKLLRHESNLSQQDLAKILGISKSSINMYERGEREPGLETLEAIADYFNVDMDYLLGKSEHRNKSAWLSQIDSSDDRSLGAFDNIFPITTKRVPFLGSIACGEPVFANEEHELYVEVGTNVHADFCLQAAGDSMIGARIHDGDIVFIRKQNTVENGEIAAVIIGDEATLKRVNYYPDKNLLILHAENPSYKDLIYTDAELDQIVILGKAVAFQSDVR